MKKHDMSARLSRAQSAVAHGRLYGTGEPIPHLLAASLFFFFVLLPFVHSHGVLMPTVWLILYRAIAAQKLNTDELKKPTALQSRAAR